MSTLTPFPPMPSVSSERPRSVAITTGTLIKIVLIGLAAAFVWFVRDIVAVVFVALLLAAIIDPFAEWFARRRMPRGAAVILVYILLGAAVSGALVVLVPLVVHELKELAANVPALPFADYLGRFRDVTAQYGLQADAASAIQAVQNGITQGLASVFTTVGGAVAAVATLFVILVLTFYMVVEDEAARRSFRHLAPEEYQPYLAALLSKMQRKVGAWLRGQLLLGLIVGVSVYIGLFLLGVHYALILALIAGLFELIPYVGPVLSVIPAALIALAQGPLLAVSVLVLFLIVQEVEAHILVPKIMQKATGLNPVVSIVALLVGVKVGGVFGAFLAIPVATMAAALLEDLFSKPSNRL